MKTYTKKLETFAYISIFVLVFIILICIAKYNYKNVDQLNFRQVTNQNSNKEGMCNKQKKHIREGMEDNNKLDLDKLLEVVNKELVKSEKSLGRNQEKLKKKQLLQRVKKYLDIESSKIMLEILNTKLKNKEDDTNEFTVENIVPDEDNEAFFKFQKYTQLSQSLQQTLNSF
tara:strand:- start:3685 stop:4200 length:516 start_codon:yes stop_codon:yes gene_type:complete